jgi:hypothetical protein
MRLGPCSLCSWIHYLIVESILVLNFAEPALKISLWFFSSILFVDNMWFLSRRGVLRTLFLFHFFSWGVGLLGVRYHGWHGPSVSSGDIFLRCERSAGCFVAGRAWCRGCVSLFLIIYRFARFRGFKLWCGNHLNSLLLCDTIIIQVSEFFVLIISVLHPSSGMWVHAVSFHVSKNMFHV